MRTPVGHTTTLSPARGVAQPFAGIALRVLVIALVVSSRATAFAPSTPDDQQRARLPASPGADVGEASYVFDSVLNETTATYVASLSSEGLLRRILFPTPTVHTIKVTYEFRGRIASRVPDSVHVTFVSDEYKAAPSRNELFVGTPPEMTISFGRAAPQNLLSVSQRIQLDSSSPRINRVEFSSGRQPQMQIPAIERVHVTRIATASLSICEFLSLVDRRAIDGIVGGLEFTLNQKVVTGLKLFAAKMLPDTAQERSIDCAARVPN